MLNNGIFYFWLWTSWRDCLQEKWYISDFVAVSQIATYKNSDLSRHGCKQVHVSFGSQQVISWSVFCHLTFRSENLLPEVFLYFHSRKFISPFESHAYMKQMCIFLHGKTQAYCGTLNTCKIVGGTISHAKLSLRWSLICYDF